MEAWPLSPLPWSRSTGHMAMAWGDQETQDTPPGCWPLVRCGSDPERLEVESELLRGPCQARLDGRILMGPLAAAGSPCLLSAALRVRSPRRGLLDGPEGWWARVGPWFSSGPRVGMRTGC